ncbi:glycerophosphodiester phosphodiesterase family protein [Microvirga lotononidis]|uniref:Glycerophosphoryl diester phosphodiesterase n=1 Tax=Microvirga lotononidis TaxID=864069 RepID=I4YXV9_9HYPH|nr:glycerophosphodiester phosphodiesterase family protein [Microvirga lotononidis]EIM28801.1 glycerophosphoryl diester phosphodiesterase [Microvirga lotononidis]WQO25467.1 glycerophosphodiester phosphodiesterase family protein [Microvirga lotononidis]
MVMIIGHRGARNLWPENSLEGFRRLAELGVEGVEFDVHLTADGELAVIHDPTLERTTMGSGPVGARTLAELQATPLRDGRECVPSLDQVLKVLGGSSLELHIELKTNAVGRAYAGMEAKVLEAVRRHGLETRSILTCFMLEVLETVRRLEPTIPVLASVDRRSCEMLGGLDRAIDRLKAIPEIYVAVEKSLLIHTMQEFTAAFGSNRLGAWVPNEDADLRYWLSQPVRQITTDGPDLAVRLRSELEST